MNQSEVVQTIRQVAAEEGFSDGDVLLATAFQESGFTNTAVGDQGHSVGAFQENDRGRGAGLSVTQRHDVAAQARRAIREFRQVQARHPDVSRGALAALAQRPADQNRYAANINRMLAGQDTGFSSAVGSAPASSANASVGTASFTPGAVAGPMAVSAEEAPDWLRQSWAAGGSFGKAVSVAAQQAVRQGARGAQEAGGAVFPVAGYTGKVEFHHGDRKAAGGSDLFAPEGTPVVAMAPGVVQWASTGAGDPLGGHNVGVRGDDGMTYYYAHFQNAPRVREGQRVGAGQQLGEVGRSGNAANTPAHLHIGIGPEIQQGAGSQGGLGKGFDAVDYLRRTLTGAAPAAPGAPAAGRLVSDGAERGAPAGAGPAVVSEGDAPDWLQQVWAAGGTFGKAAQGVPQAVRQGVQGLRAGEDAAGAVWPVAGQRPGQVNNPFGGQQARSAGATVALPASNVGADLTARYGADVVSPVSGTVLQVFDAPNETDRNLNSGWGGSTLLRGDDGYTYRLSHAKPGSVGVRPGQRVRAGEYLQQIGMTGNTTGPHLDLEKFDQPGHFVDPVATMGQRVATVAGGVRRATEELATQGPWTVTAQEAPDWLKQAWDAGSTVGRSATEAAGQTASRVGAAAQPVADAAAGAWKVASEAAPDWLKQAWDAGSTIGR